MKIKYYIGKTRSDTQGIRGKRYKYITSSLSTSKEETQFCTEYLAGFAEWEIVEVKLLEIKKGKK